ncbi:AMP-binding protein [uncultured Roseibium sp.]|uniref:class I adenylate-forming enzyme family protein n=1 Tax=uncultured Roseibium sp. TaxID=1936171 RepID=UPI00262FED37|nr:AMP-binding protein [uncultured Roseibium sp.]
MNPAEWLYRSAARMPDAPALHTGTTCTANYGEFAKRAGSIALALSKEDVGKGDRVAFYCANRTEYLEALYGAWWIGASVVPINAKLHVKEAAWMIENSGASFVFADEESGRQLARLVDQNVRIVSLSGEEFGAMRCSQSDKIPVALQKDDLAWLFYTSGTTGKPKGVMITCGNILSMTLTYFSDVDEVKTQDAILYAAPMSHGAGLYNFMHVLKGARHVVPEGGGFDAEEILKIAPLIGSVSMFAAPTMVRRLIDEAKAKNLSGKGLRTIVYAGGPMYEADILEAVNLMGPRFIQIYGQGECPMGITALPREEVSDRGHPRWRERLNSVGTAQSAVLVAIVDEAGNNLSPGEVGEIVVKGPTVMKGYWNNPDATSKTLRQGWLWTGDLGRMDDAGYVTLQDRSKDVIISGGSNIYPREVEEALLSHVGVREVAVVGRVDPEWGETVVAFVVCNDDHGVTTQLLDSHCLDQIARFKRPKEYRFVSELPKNNYGKVLKTKLRDRVNEEEQT